MEVKIRQRSGDTKDQGLIREAAEYFLREVFEDTSDLKLTVSLCKLKDLWGDCTLDYNNNGYIRINVEVNVFEQINTLAHEIIHFKQFKSKELDFDDKGGDFLWQGRSTRSNDNERLTPWERQAEAGEYFLAQSFFNHKLLKRHLDTQAYFARLTR